MLACVRLLSASSGFSSALRLDAASSSDSGLPILVLLIVVIEREKGGKDESACGKEERKNQKKRNSEDAPTKVGPFWLSANLAVAPPHHHT